MNSSQTRSLGYITDITVYEAGAGWIYVVGKTAPGGWKILKFLRAQDPERDQGLEVHEDPAVYTPQELDATLKALHSGNQRTGGLRPVAEKCPALMACFRWNGPYYLLLATRTRIIGNLFGADVFGIASTALVPLGSTRRLPPEVLADEKRKQRLLGLVMKFSEFFFSFAWPVWTTLQRTVAAPSEDAFGSDRVWNQHLTSALRQALGHARWTVPLCHGFWKQRHLSLLGRPLTVTLIARRSRRFAGTRYRKRGCNDDGFVANEVEVEQLVELRDSLSTRRGGGRSAAQQEGRAVPVSSVVQVRGSVPLFWSQAWDPAALRPAVRMLNHLDPLHVATARHFEDLRRRYGDPIVCLDLLRQADSLAQESGLSAAYSQGVKFLNRKTPPEKRLHYVNWDLRHHSRTQGKTLLTDLQRVQAPLLARTGVFASNGSGEVAGCPLALQHGVLRTNCIDCLDRTNVAQFSFGLLALGMQLHALGVAPSPLLDPQSSLAAELMTLFEAMGHALAHQYGGSEAHSTFFQRWRGDWAVGRELLTSLRRFYSNAVTDEDKQAAINLFLGSPAATVGASPVEPPGIIERSSSPTGLDQMEVPPELQGSLSSVSLDSAAGDHGGTHGRNPSLAEILASSADNPCEAFASEPAPPLPLADTPPAESAAAWRWWKPAPPPASQPHRAPGLESLDDLLPPDVGHVRLVAPPKRYAPSSWLSLSKPKPQAAVRRGAAAVPPLKLPPPLRTASFPTLPSPPRSARLLRSSSASVAELASAVSDSTRIGGPADAALHTLQQRQPSMQAQRSSRDLRGDLVVRVRIPPRSQSSADFGSTSAASAAFDDAGDYPPSPVLPEGTGWYHTIAGLNLEGAEMPQKPAPSVSPLAAARRLSFASFAAVKHLMWGPSSSSSSSVQPSNTPTMATGGGGSAGPFCRPSSTANQRHGSSHARTSYSSHGTPREHAGGGGGGPPALQRRSAPAPVATDMAWMLSQYQAVVHGLDDLGLSREVAPLWRPGCNVVESFAEAERRSAEEQVAALRKVSAPMGRAERAAAERLVAAALRPTMLVGVPQGLMA